MFGLKAFFILLFFLKKKGFGHPILKDCFFNASI